MAFEGFPFIVGWELTLACNIHCRHCGSSASKARKQELTLKEALAICEQFPELLVQEVNFTGGEPLLHPHWQKIITHLAKLEIYTKILSNGLVLDPEMVDRISDAGIVGLGVSLDGMESTHDRIRDYPGLFGRALDGIEQARGMGLETTIITTVNALNVDELPALYQKLLSAGVQRWQVQPIFPLGRANETPELLLPKDTYMRLGDFVKKYGPKAMKAGLDIRPGDSFGYFTNRDTRSPKWRGCPAGILSCGITSDGKIKGCLSLPDEIIEGDLRENDLWTIWFHPDSFAYTRNYTPDALNGICKSCDRAAECKGGCSAMSYGSTGKFHGDPFCFYAIEKLCREKTTTSGAKQSS
jgi:radical SAM protein with 4Fe4S-binding SPASM domain